jgi:hypothetical protein
MRGLVALAALCLAPAAPRHDAPGDVLLFAGDPARLGAAERALLLGDGALVVCLEDAVPDWARARAPVVLPVRGRALPDDVALARRVERATVIVLAGGAFLDWWHTLRPDGEASRLQRALLDARRRGALLCASGGAAAWLAAGFAPRDELERIERNPRAPRPPAAALRGLGLGGGLLLDGAGVADAGFARLVEAAWRLRAERALFLVGDVAWRWNERARRATVSGAPGGRALLLERDGARADRTGLRGARLSWLAAGDGVDLRRGRCDPPPGVPRGAFAEGVARARAPCAAAQLEALVARALEARPAPARIEVAPPEDPNEPWLVLSLDAESTLLRPREGRARVLRARATFTALPDGGE